jgi:hypothetical protein
MRWRWVLPSIGLSLFGAVSYHSYSFMSNLETPGTSHRYFWWSSIRLDSDPLNKYEGGPIRSKDGTVGFELGWVRIDPGLIPRSLMLTALPAFAAGGVLVRGLGRLGVSQVSTFMVLMPLLIFTWYYFIGRLVDRWRDKRTLTKRKAAFPRE